MKTKEDKIVISQFKDKSSNFWVSNKHYHLNVLGEVLLVAGGLECKEEKEALESFVRRNKKVYLPREQSILDSEEIEWSTLYFGKHKGLKLNEVKDIEPKYLKWIIENSADKKLIEEIKELLKIK